MGLSPRVFVPASVFLLGLAFLTACTKQDRLYRVSGTVNYDGKPIPKGLIFFDPQSDGPQGFANITSGKYDTAQQGKGIRGGTYNIRVNGYDGKEANEAPFGQALFPEFTTTKELPPEDSTYDLNISRTR